MQRAMAMTSSGSLRSVAAGVSRHSFLPDRGQAYHVASGSFYAALSGKNQAALR